MSERRKATATSNFGAGRRESHDSSAFYERFTPPEISDDEEVNKPGVVDEIYCGDARAMTKVRDKSVALVVTSPPYFAGKEYEEALGEGHVPGDYLAFLGMLRDVFAECVRVLEPGGRIAVNVANLGRKPYRSLSADIIRILQDDLALLMRGEIIWWKAKGATGSTAWGSFQSAANPVLRDLTERVVVASKGRFNRALSAKAREKAGLPFQNSITKEEFMEATLDVWQIAPESARRVGHPAPFPVELPRRLIELYTYEGDVVLDPFMGSGSTALAALRTGRHYVGYDMEPAYVDLARARIAAEAGG
ncbi:MAG TPA: site-specific DNA-methyltransferase [Acidimicrobiia bacterium]|nr:site-specific DNA-methyltransferase [Acidimicrobiia bacterium]